MTTTREFRWDHPFAPTLTGQLGSLLSVLEKCLVGTAGVAYGSGATEKLAAGWTKPFSGTNKAVFRNSLAAGGTGAYWRVDDTGVAPAGAREARVRAYKAMTTVDVGTDPAPTVAQSATGEIIRKSETLDAVQRPWILLADEQTAYLFTSCEFTALTSASGPGETVALMGDFESFVPGDAYRFAVGARKVANSLYSSSCWYPCSSGFSAPASPDGIFVGRGRSGSGSAVTLGVAVLAQLGATIGITSQTASNPDPGAGEELWLTSALLAENRNVRGRLRGIALPICDQTTVTAGTRRTSVVGNPPGSVLTTVRDGGQGGGVGGFAIESVLSW